MISVRVFAVCAKKLEKSEVHPDISHRSGAGGPARKWPDATDANP